MATIKKSQRNQHQQKSKVLIALPSGLASAQQIHIRISAGSAMTKI